MMRSAACAAIVLSAGCAARMNAERRLYGPEHINPNGSFGVFVATVSDQRAVSFQENFVFALKDQGFRVVAPDAADYTVVVTPTLNSDQEVESMSFAVAGRGANDVFVARVRVSNVRVGPSRNDASFAKRGAEELRKLIRP